MSFRESTPTHFCCVCGRPTSDSRIFENEDGTEDYAHAYPARCAAVESLLRSGTIGGVLSGLIGKLQVVASGPES